MSPKASTPGTRAEGPRVGRHGFSWNFIEKKQPFRHLATRVAPMKAAQFTPGQCTPLQVQVLHPHPRQEVAGTRYPPTCLPEPHDPYKGTQKMHPPKGCISKYRGHLLPKAEESTWKVSTCPPPKLPVISEQQGLKHLSRCVL